MKLIRFGHSNFEKPGIIDATGTKLDVSEFGEDFDSSFFEKDGISRLTKWLSTNKERCPIVADTERLGPPIKSPSKIVCVGLNYAEHARESGMEIPTEPVLFFKATSAICGPNDNLVIPKNGTKADWEVELAVIIGKKAKYIDESEALNYVAGYTLHNDYSERAFQLEQGGQWVKGKSADTFAPMGPFIATKDEIPDPHQLQLWLKVNGETLQNSNTNDFIFSIPNLVSYISGFMTLLPGDVISTGTPPGVGLGFDPPRYLKPGDVVELGITGLGSSRQEVSAWTLG